MCYLQNVFTMHSKLSVITLLCLFLIAASAAAQAPEGEPAATPVQTIKGAVRNFATQQPIIGASVAVVGTRHGAISKSDGSFRILGVPVGRHSVQVRSIGFEPVTLQV